MNERLLQYIWQFQHYNTQNLQTIEEEPLLILDSGKLNRNQGPDFLDGKIKVAHTTWAGHIELHVKTSHWKQHGHGKDRNYKNIILHVVWEHDADLGLPFPTLVLQQHVPKLLLSKYAGLLSNYRFIPCEQQLHKISTLTWQAWKERLLVERMEQRYTQVLERLKGCRQHWEQCFWWMLARNCGLPVNNDAFESVARSIPLTLLARHSQQVQQVEALLLGQSGLLEQKFKDQYPRLLQREYAFLKNKYPLKAPPVSLLFLRMRPSNFPTVRLAQLAMLIHERKLSFAAVKASPSLAAMKALLNATASDYWHYHYRPGETSAYKEKHLGSDIIDNICINTIIPLLFAYGHHHKEQAYKDKALEWLSELKPEKNKVTNGFAELGISFHSAFDSQSALELKKSYCDKKHCLDCAIGNKLLRG